MSFYIYLLEWKWANYNLIRNLNERYHENLSMALRDFQETQHIDGIAGNNSMRERLTSFLAQISFELSIRESQSFDWTILRERGAITVTRWNYEETTL